MPRWPIHQRGVAPLHRQYTTRCTPTQKAEIVRLIRTHTGKCTAAIGDGGNDVGMIQAAHVGIGIEGREGRQAALAADFSMSQVSRD